MPSPFDALRLGSKSFDQLETKVLGSRAIVYWRFQNFAKFQDHDHMSNWMLFDGSFQLSNMISLWLIQEEIISHYGN